ncbi:MAG: metallophosphoesterase family protein [Candidatus Brocadiia bacterium]
MKLLHISDTHFGDEMDFNEEALKIAERDIYDSTSDLLLHTGDVTQAGKLDQYEWGRDFLEGIQIPRVVIPGNHDVRSGGIALFEKYVGPVNGVEVHGEAVVVYVNSAIADSNDGRVGQVKFDMMREALHKYHDKSIKIVAIHHHTIPTPRAGRERNILSNAGDLLDMFLRFDVDLVLSGHRHYPNVYRVEDTVFVNAGPVSCRKTRYGDLNSYNIIEITEETVNVETRRVDGSCKIKNFPRGRKRTFYDFGPRLGRIVQMSNSFIANSSKFLADHLHNALNTINSLQPDIVVHCGGIVREGISENYELARDYLPLLEPPIVYTPAARDLNYLGYDLFPAQLGPLEQTYITDNIMLRGLCSSQYDSPTGVIGDTQRKVLFKSLETREEDFLGLFFHHNVTPIPHAREKGLMEDAGDLLREAVDFGIDLILTGTSSHAYAAKIGNTVIANANSVSSVYQRSTYGASFNLIDIYEKVIAVFEINSLWGTQKLLGMWPRTGENLKKRKPPGTLRSDTIVGELNSSSPYTMQD